MGEDTPWLAILLSKSFEAWIAIVVGILYVWYKSGATTRIGKAIEAGISGLISLSLGPDVILITGYPPTVVHFVIAVFGFLALDVCSSIVSDKTELARIGREFVRRWLGLGKDSGDKG